jgi:hypothetical protein
MVEYDVAAQTVWLVSRVKNGKMKQILVNRQVPEDGTADLYMDMNNGTMGTAGPFV